MKILNAPLTKIFDVESMLKDKLECMETASFLQMYLRLNPTNRPTANELLSDPWLAGSAEAHGTCTLPCVAVNMGSRNDKSLTNYPNSTRRIGMATDRLRASDITSYLKKASTVFGAWIAASAIQLEAASDWPNVESFKGPRSLGSRTLLYLYVRSNLMFHSCFKYIET